MADGEIELKTQEIVFVGHLYLNPSEILRYGQFLDTNKILTTEPAKTIWRKLRSYYDKYNAVPDRDSLGSLWGEKYLENLMLGIEIAEDDEVKTQFILDTFSDTMQLLTYKKAVADMEKVLETGSNSLDHEVKLNKLLEIERTLGTQLNIVRQAGVNPGGTNIEVFNDWAEGKLPFQKPTIPIPIPGMDWVQGTPVGTVNVLIGGYGVGKTSSLCTMAAELSKTEDILYVTLETHSNAVVFKIAACQTDGKLPANYVFMNPATFTPEEAEAIDTAFSNDIQGKHTIYYLDMLPGQATAAQIEGYLRNLMRQYSTTISTVFVDYAGLMRTNSGGGREDVGWGYTGTIITELSAVAKALNLTIWTAAQAGGDASHTVTDSIGTEFKPLRGGKLYGSKEVLFDASMALGISMMRSTQHSHLAVGVISTVKNRYGKEFYDYICEMDYSKSKLNVLGVLRGLSEADVIETVRTHLKKVERDYEIAYHMKHKQGVQDELSKHTFKTEFKVSSGNPQAKQTAKQPPSAKPQRNPSAPADGNSLNSAY